MSLPEKYSIDSLEFEELVFWFERNVSPGIALVFKGLENILRFTGFVVVGVKGKVVNQKAVFGLARKIVEKRNCGGVGAFTVCCDVIGDDRVFAVFYKDREPSLFFLYGSRSPPTCSS